MDYDGTLAPISLRPELALMPYNTRIILKGIVKNNRIFVSIISGRMLKPLKQLVGLKGIYYAGCHGLEMESAYVKGPLAGLERYKALIKEVKISLIKELKDIMPINALDIEDKGIILSLHYRRAGENRIKGLRRIFYRVSRPHTKSGEMVVTRNKKVLELRPNIKWDKGMYCLYMLKKLSKRREKVLPIYIGDDRTDETAFKALGPRGITIFVKGERKTSLAQYYVDSTSKVRDFLQAIAENIKV